MSFLPETIVEMKEPSYSVNEDDDAIVIVIRSGDLTPTTTVRVVTESDTAEEPEDFDERPNTEQSAIVFKPGKKVNNICRIY